MIQKNFHKISNQPIKIKINPASHELLPPAKPLFHYGSINSITATPNKSKQNPQKKQYNSMKMLNIQKYSSENQQNRMRSGTDESLHGRNSMLSQDTAIYDRKSKYQQYPRDTYNNSISSIDSKSSRSSVQTFQPKVQLNLKQTSSTNCPQWIIGVKKAIPAFLKIKSKIMMNKKNNNKKLKKQGFILHKKLGQGKFGKVYLVQEIITGFVLAMKVVEKKKVTSGGFLDQFIRELKIQAYLKHPNIIELYGFFDDAQYFYTLMQLGCDGQLYNLISQKKKLTEEGTSFITKNLLQAVNYMHRLKITHRDIKPENIVLIMGNVKICDFGWAVNKLNKQQLRSTYCGTPFYLSPEILKGHKYDEKVDLWAIGILAYELLLGKSPFEIYDYEDLYKIVTEDVHFPTNKKISKQFQQFILRILKKNPKERLNSSELLQLKFIKKYDAFETCQELCQ